MGTGDGHQTVVGEKRTLRRALQYLGRTVLLNCPVCGTKPIFKRLRYTRTCYDWFTPLDGGPRGGYPYEREPGYFLLAVLGFNYSFGLVLGVGSYIVMAATGHMADMSAWMLMATTVLPIPVINLLIARHAKALFIALDHFVDPFVHENDDGSDDDDDDGNSRLAPDQPAGGGGELPPYGDHADQPAVLVGAGR